MEGVLWKWTNYLSGWQPRWFVLESGVLSYYKSQEDVNNGCKGSIKMSACDIKVHPTDNTRLDLIIPGEQHYYVKAAQPQERQSWLIALGSAKATYGQPPNQEPSGGGDSAGDTVRAKKSELRLYCDLLMQQVHSVKQSITQKDSEKVWVPDFEKLNEATSLLSATCDTFIQTLDEVMKIVHDVTHVTEIVHPSSPKRLSSASSRLAVSRSDSQEISVRSRLPSTSSLEGPSLIRSRRKSSAEGDSVHSDSAVSEPSSTLISSSHVGSCKDSPRINHTAAERERGFEAGVKINPGPSVGNCSHGIENGTEGSGRPAVDAKSDDGEGSDDFKDAIDVRTPTFFSAMSTSFANVRLLDDNGVPVQPFLDACKELVPIFDKLNSTAFAPVKMDFSGNIRKIQQKHLSSAGSAAGFLSLQSMVLSEVRLRQHTNSNSATVALCWLKRGLEFIREFLREICSGGPDLSECASNAYGRTLKKYHGWVVRGVFAVAVKALPYRDEFLCHLAAEEIDTVDESFLSSLMNDMEVYLQHMNNIILVISQFYTAHNLDVEEQV
ncbi:pleckstrin homology domain-containing family A member 8-like isoform X1 [Pomacea canaliculata]|uniref:pleckstrin homology domain-containing family A member 8-like isoform X1 n=1 Tax=Pomacea canaliculata TaxID=400727 RepID=UPI000D7331FB|nr:pleckstrin homology domain-containing family A member 8-like isoform X1 [Pomacea canaliculata]